MNQKGESGFKWLCLTLLLVGSLSGFTQSKVVVKGMVKDLVTAQPLENTCIHNMSTGVMAFSNKNGDFALFAQKTDTLIISRVGYDMEMLVMNDSLLNSKGRITVQLVVRAFMLRSVSIYALKPYPLFIKDLTKEIPTKKIDIPGIEIPPEEKVGYDINNGNLLRGTPLASPITALYNQFSRKAKMDRMYADLVEHQAEVLRLQKKYNPEIVQRLTKLDNEELEEFMVYCSFTYYTLVTSTDQEIEQMIFAKFIQYKKENGDR